MTQYKSISLVILKFIALTITIIRQRPKTKPTTYGPSAQPQSRRWNRR